MSPDANHRNQPFHHYSQSTTDNQPPQPSYYNQSATDNLTMVLEESSTCVYTLRSNHFGIRRYRPILRPIFLVVRLHILIH